MPKIINMERKKKEAGYMGRGEDMKEGREIERGERNKKTVYKTSNRNRSWGEEKEGNDEGEEKRGGRG